MKIIFVEIQEMNIPQKCLKEGAWYQGRQFWKGRFGLPGQILSNSDQPGKSTKMTENDIKKLTAKLLKEPNVYR